MQFNLETYSGWLEERGVLSGESVVSEKKLRRPSKKARKRRKFALKADRVYKRIKKHSSSVESHKCLLLKGIAVTRESSEWKDKKIEKYVSDESTQDTDGYQPNLNPICG